MSFRKRNTVISAAQPPQTPSPPKPATARPKPPPSKAEEKLPDGVRLSALDGGRLTISTGTSSLDSLLAGYAGLPMGTCLMVEEHGTTDFSGVLMRYYAAEGLVQGHRVHVLGFDENWRYELPGVADAKALTGAIGHHPRFPPPSEDKMKIAWRYEALANRSAPGSPPEDSGGPPFCHSFDLTKRLTATFIRGTLEATPTVIPLSLERAKAALPLRLFTTKLQRDLKTSAPTVIHRVVIPALLSPALYSPDSCRPTEVLQFLHSLRYLLREYSGQLTAMISLPLSLFPRSTGLTRWMELLCDGVIELVPLPPNRSGDGQTGRERADAKKEDYGQGILKVHTLPIFHEKGGGETGSIDFREDLSFSLSSSKGLVIKPLSLPPLGEEGQKERSPAGTVKDGIDF